MASILIRQGRFVKIVELVELINEHTKQNDSNETGLKVLIYQNFNASTHEAQAKSTSKIHNSAIWKSEETTAIT